MQRGEMHAEVTGQHMTAINTPPNADTSHTTTNAITEESQNYIRQPAKWVQLFEFITAW